MEEKEMYELKIANLEKQLDEIDKRIKELDEEKQQLKDKKVSYINTMRYLNKIRSELLSLHKKK